MCPRRRFSDGNRFNISRCDSMLGDYLIRTVTHQPFAADFCFHRHFWIETNGADESPINATQLN